MSDHQHNAIRERGAWSDKRGEMIRRFVAELAESVIEDYDHQSGPRGVSTSPDFDQDIAMRETLGEFRSTMTRIDMAVRDAVDAAWYERRYPQ